MTPCSKRTELLLQPLKTSWLKRVGKLVVTKVILPLSFVKEKGSGIQESKLPAHYILIKTSQDVITGLEHVFQYMTSALC